MNWLGWFHCASLLWAASWHFSISVEQIKVQADLNTSVPHTWRAKPQAEEASILLFLGCSKYTAVHAGLHELISSRAEIQTRGYTGKKKQGTRCCRIHIILLKSEYRLFLFSANLKKSSAHFIKLTHSNNISWQNNMPKEKVRKQKWKNILVLTNSCPTTAAAANRMAEAMLYLKTWDFQSSRCMTVILWSKLEPHQGQISPTQAGLWAHNHNVILHMGSLLWAEHRKLRRRLVNWSIYTKP